MQVFLLWYNFKFSEFHLFRFSTVKDTHVIHTSHPRPEPFFHRAPQKRDLRVPVLYLYIQIFKYIALILSNTLQSKLFLPWSTVPAFHFLIPTNDFLVFIFLRAPPVHCHGHDTGCGDVDLGPRSTMVSLISCPGQWQKQLYGFELGSLPSGWPGTLGNQSNTWLHLIHLISHHHRRVCTLASFWNHSHLSYHLFGPAKKWTFIRSNKNCVR